MAAKIKKPIHIIALNIWQDLIASTNIRKYLQGLGREEWLNRTREFRESLQVQGAALSATVVQTRQEERG